MLKSDQLLATQSAGGQEFLGTRVYLPEASRMELCHVVIVHTIHWFYELTKATQVSSMWTP